MSASLYIQSQARTASMTPFVSLAEAAWDSKPRRLGREEIELDSQSNAIVSMLLDGGVVFNFDFDFAFDFIRGCLAFMLGFAVMAAFSFRLDLSILKTYS